MPSTVPGPPFGDDYRLVSGLTVAAPAVSRLFLPLRRGDGTYLGWSEAARAVSTTLTATTRWPELEAAAATSSRDWLGDPQPGTMDSLTADRLIAGLRKSSIFTVTVALWTGYGEDIAESLGAALQPITSPPSSFLTDSYFVASTRPVEWLATRTSEARHQFPCAVWTADFSFIMATWMYQDSYYISASRETTELLGGEGLELLPIDRDAPIPSVGD